MKTVAEILKSKASPVIYSVGPDSSVLDAIKMMAQHSIGALVVLDEGKVVGIVTERDYSRKVILKNRAAVTTPVRDIMTSAVIYVTPDQNSQECMALMTERRLRHLPVMDGTRLIGLVSIGDLVKGIIDEQEFIISQLEHYISGVKGY